jgi:hypothetical protein
MHIFHFHPETGIYLGPGLADPSPLEPGVHLIPAHSTTVPPAPAPEGTQRQWTGEEWMLVDIPEPPAPPETPEPHTPAPDFRGFLDAVVVGPLYQKVLEQSVTSPAVNVAFTRAMGALILAATGKPNIVALQSGLAALLEAMTLTQNDLDALQALLVLTGMDELVTLPAP